MSPSATIQRSHATAFRALHQRREGFLMPNAWDAGSARVIAAEGFLAIATTSAGIAFFQGRQDYAVDTVGLGLSREEMFKVQMEKDSAGQWVRSKYSEPQNMNRQAGTNTIISWQHARVFLNGLRGMLKKDTDLKYWQLMAGVRRARWISVCQRNQILRSKLGLLFS
jgi:hypothetical protein